MGGLSLDYQASLILHCYIYHTSGHIIWWKTWHGIVPFSSKATARVRTSGRPARRGPGGVPAAGAGRAHAPAKATGRGGTASGEGETSPDQDESGRGACRRSMTRFTKPAGTGYRGYRSNRPGPVPVPAGFKSAQIQILNLNSKKWKNPQKILKILQVVTNLMMSNFFKYSFI